MLVDVLAMALVVQRFGVEISLAMYRCLADQYLVYHQQVLTVSRKVQL